MLERQRNLIIFNESTSNPIVNELEQLGFEVISQVWQPSAAQRQRLFLAWVYFYDALNWNISRLQRLRRGIAGHAPLVAWNRDAPSYKGRPAWKIRLAQWRKPLDIYMSHSLADGRAFGSQQLYMANAVNPERYHLYHRSLEALRQPEQYRVDVSFFGGLNGAHHAGQLRRQQFFTELASRLDALNISHQFFDSEGLSLAQQIDCIQYSRINLQYGATCEYPGQIAGGLPERCFGVPACGGFLLADERVHAKDDFCVGQNYVEFSSVNECVEKIQGYLQNFSHARDLAEAAYYHVRAYHAYSNRAQTVIEAVQAWHKARAAF